MNSKVGSIRTFDRNLSRIMAAIYENEIAGLFDDLDNLIAREFHFDPILEENRQERKREYIWKIQQLQKMSKEQRDKYHRAKRLAFGLCVQCGRNIKYPDSSGHCPICSSKNKKF